MSIEQIILSANRSGYLLIDQELRVTAAGGYLAVFDAAPAPGDPLLELFPELVGSEEALAAMLAGRLDQLELAYVNRRGAGGAVRYLDLLTLPHGDAAGPIHGLIQVVSDVTERGLREQARVQQHNELRLLEKQVSRQNIALARANAELLRVTRLKDELLAGMSHEVRTPLTAILGFAELLRAQLVGPLNAEQIDALSRIDESSRFMLALINDFLDIARFEAGRAELDLVAAPVRSLCEASLRMVKELALRKQVATELSLDPAVEVVRADDRRLRQALINLLSNAVKFTPGGGTIGLAVVGDAEARQVRFTVWDTGIGIAAADMGRLFQPFAQLSNPFQQQHKGSGLGLVLVAQLAELHGGSVTLSSEVGQGSQFTLTIPWSPDEQGRLLQHLGRSAPQEPDLSVEELAALPPPARPGPVLLIEDDEPSAAMLAGFLQRCAYPVVRARSTEEALACVREELPSLVITDVRQRGMHGVAQIRQLRQNVALQGAPIIVLTALAVPGDEERCLEAGASAYLRKPVRLSHLASLIGGLQQHPRGAA